MILKGVTSTEQVNETAGRINEALSAPVMVDGRTLVTTVSIGVSLYPRDGADMGELLRHSDTAMYQAKDRGRNNFQLFSPGMDRRLKERIAIETSLRTALQSRQLDVHYQPIIDIQSHKVVALESLLRWKHPNHGYIRPERFIDRGRGDRPDRADRRVRAAAGDRGHRALAPGRRHARAGRRQHLGRAAAALQLPETIARLTKQHGLEPSHAAARADRERGVRAARGARGEANEDAVAQAARARRAHRHR